MLFVPPFNNTITLQNISSDTLGNDFIAVKTGDLGGITEADTTLIIDDSDDRLDATLKFFMEDRELKAGEQISIDLAAENFEQMIAYQWILEFDPEVLAYTGYDKVNLENLGDLGFGEIVIHEGKLVLTWFNGFEVTKSAEESLFTLNFEVKADANRLSDLMKVTAYDYFKAVAYKGDETPMEIELHFTEPKAETFAFELNQNIPNPFKDETVISFTLPETTDATLTIMDITGRVLKQYTDKFERGYNEVSIDRSDLPQAGTFTLRIEDAK